MAYHVCEFCAIAILDGDMSHLEDDQRDVLMAFMDERGLLADAGWVPQDGYWDCEACGETQAAGTAWAVEQA